MMVCNNTGMIGDDYMVRALCDTDVDDDRNHDCLRILDDVTVTPSMDRTPEYRQDNI